MQAKKGDEATRNQLAGDLDDAKIVDGASGERGSTESVVSQRRNLVHSNGAETACVCCRCVSFHGTYEQLGW